MALSRGLIERVRTLEMQQLDPHNRKWQPKSLFAFYLHRVIGWAFHNTHGLDNFDRQAIAALIQSDPFADWLCTWQLREDWDPWFVAALHKRESLPAMFLPFLTRQDIPFGPGWDIDFVERAIENWSLNETVEIAFPTLPPPPAEMILERAIDTWKRCQGPGHTESPTLEEVHDYLERKFGQMEVNQCVEHPNN